MNTRQRLLDIFQLLLSAFGKRNWWPGDTRLEIIVGAVLTQNTSWKNVERTIRSMKIHGVLDMDALRTIDSSTLARIIKSSGFYNQKAERLKNIVQVLHEIYGSSIEYNNDCKTDVLRKLLLNVKGIGPETADSILLYAFDRPVFVVDAYTIRFLRNHRLYGGSDRYEDVQGYFMKNLPLDAYLFNEYHALIVCLCQTYCKKTPECEKCPLSLAKTLQQTHASANQIRVPLGTQ